MSADRHERDVAGVGRLLVELLQGPADDASVRARGAELLEIDDAAEDAIAPGTVVPARLRAAWAAYDFVALAIRMGLDPEPWRGEVVAEHLADLSAVLGHEERRRFAELDLRTKGTSDAYR